MFVYFIFLLCFFFFQLANCTCPVGSLEWLSNCYIFNSKAVDFANAETECTKFGGHLTSIHDAFTNNVIEQNAYDFFQHFNGTDFWIGGINSQYDWEWTDGSTFDFLDWKNGQPQIVSGSNCMSLSMTDGYWSSVNCYQAKPFVCGLINDGSITATIPIIMPTTPPPKYCSEGWSYFEPSDSCYIVFSPNDYPDRDWEMAEDFCLTFGAHSPSIHSEEEQAFLHGYVEKYEDGIWLGLYSGDNGTTWQYTDNSPVDYLYWGINEPQINDGRNCVMLDADRRANIGWFSVIPCSETIMTMCKKPRE